MNALAVIDLVIVVFIVGAAAGYIAWKMLGRRRSKPQVAKLGGTLSRALEKRAR